MTIVFTVMQLCPIHSFVSPEFAAELNQIQTQTAKERLGEKLSSHLNPTIKSTGVNKSQGAKRDDSQ